MIDLFQKQKKLKYDGLDFLKKLTYFKTHRLDMLECQERLMKWSKMEWLFVFKIKHKKYIVIPN